MWLLTLLLFLDWFASLPSYKAITQCHSLLEHGVTRQTFSQAFLVHILLRGYSDWWACIFHSQALCVRWMSGWHLLHPWKASEPVSLPSVSCSRRSFHFISIMVPQRNTCFCIRCSIMSKHQWSSSSLECKNALVELLQSSWSRC